jgi:hypothetical protein
MASRDRDPEPTPFSPFLLMLVGYPADHARVPDITRKYVEQVTLWR